MTGKIKTLHSDKNFGFIRGDNGKDYFFHKQEIYGFWDDFKVGMSVEFEDAGDLGKGPRAANINLIHKYEE